MEEDSISFIHVHISCWGLPDCFTSKSSFSFSFCTHFFEEKKKKSNFVLAYPEYNFCPPSWLTLIRKKIYKDLFISYASFCNCTWLDPHCSEKKPDGGSARFTHGVFYTSKTLVSQRPTHLVTRQRFMQRHEVTWFHAWLEKMFILKREGGKSDPLHAFYAKEKINKNAWGFVFFLIYFLSFRSPWHQWHSHVTHEIQLSPIHRGFAYVMITCKLHLFL